MQLQLKKFSLVLQHTFRISRESHTHQDSLIVVLRFKGQTGYGEATANPYYKISAASMEIEIEAVRKEIEAYPFSTPQDFHEFLVAQKLTNFAICALDLAAHDLYGKILGRPLYEIWNTNTKTYPITNYTIGIASISKMVQKMKEKPWPIYKIKLGTPDDLLIVTELRKHTNATFRVDANCAWTVEETLKYAYHFHELGVEFIEQPLAATNWKGMHQLKDECMLPIIADESCILETDVTQCAAVFDGINIKLTKCGGLTPALRMIQEGKALGLKIMVGCMTESTVGISAIAQLLPQLDFVDMDGAMLLQEDIASGVQIAANGKVIFSKHAGSGIKLGQ